LNAEKINEELKKWIEINEDVNFESEKHLQNSFNNWLRNIKSTKNNLKKDFKLIQFDKSDFDLND
jgi:hypothetical protein